MLAGLLGLLGRSLATVNAAAHPLTGRNFGEPFKITNFLAQFGIGAGGGGGGGGVVDSARAANASPSMMSPQPARQAPSSRS